MSIFCQLFSTLLTVYVILTAERTFGNHVMKGCLSYHDKKILHTLNKAKIKAVAATAPEWCNNDLVSNDLTKKSPQTSRSPYLIHTWSFTQSNAIRIKIRSSKKASKETYIREIIIQARDMSKSTVKKALGMFYPYPTDAELSCCDDHLDLDTARIYRTDPEKQNASVNFLWIPSGFQEDFEGGFEFVATVANSLSQYWTGIKSHPQVARRSVKLEKPTEDTEESLIE